MVNVGKLSDDPWPKPDVPPVTIEQVSTAANDVADSFRAVAATLHWAGDPADTSRAFIELGPKLTAFGDLHGRFMAETYKFLNGGVMAAALLAHDSKKDLDDDQAH